jgi:hypothetical protein
MFEALEYVMGIYALSIAVTLMVWVATVAIRWVSSERPRSLPALGESRSPLAAKGKNHSC